ncbi:hypothetical protein [Methanopyrus sp.]
MVGDPGSLALILLVPLLVVASLPAGSVVLASALAPVAATGGLALEYRLMDPRTVPVLGLLAIPGLVLGLRTARRYPEQLLRRRMIIAAIMAVITTCPCLLVYAFRGNLGPTLGDVSRHTSYALTLITTGQPPVFYDTLRQEYRPVHYPSGLGHIAVTESIISYLYDPRDVREASSWRVQFGSVLLELVEYYVDAAIITSAVIDLIVLTRRRLPLKVVPPLATIIYLSCSTSQAQFVPFFQSLAMIAASMVALTLNSRLLPGLITLGAVVIHFYSAMIMALITIILLRVKKVKMITPMLMGAVMGAIVQLPYVRWSTMVYFPRYPAHPTHLPPDRLRDPLAVFLEFLATALVAMPVSYSPVNELPYILPFAAVTAVTLIKGRGSLPSELRAAWIMCLIASPALAAVSGRPVGERLLFTVPLLTATSLGLSAADGYLSALGVLYGYCVLTTKWWTTFTTNGYGGALPVDVLKEHWRLFHESFSRDEPVATVPEGPLPFTTTWKPREVARVVKTFPEPGLPVLVTVSREGLRYLHLPPTQLRVVGGEYVVGKLPPVGRVWVAGDRAGSLRRNVLIGAERHGSEVSVHVLVVDYGWVPTPDVCIEGKVRKGSMVFSTPRLDVTGYIGSIRVRRVPEGFLVRISYQRGVRVVRITIHGAEWAGGKLVFRGSLRELIENLRVTGDLV